MSARGQDMALLAFCKERYKYIAYNKARNTWRPRFLFKGKTVGLGSFKNPDIALHHLRTFQSYANRHPEATYGEIIKTIFLPPKWNLIGEQRIAMLNAYGPFCHCCKESHVEFLTLEHSYRDGAAHRKAIGGRKEGIILDLRHRGWPKEGYTIFCMNCNWGSRKTGVCPHNIVEPIKTTLKPATFSSIIVNKNVPRAGHLDGDEITVKNVEI